MGYSLNSILWKGTELRRFYYFSVLLKPTHGTGVNATYHNNFWLVLYFYLAFQVTTSDIKIQAYGGVTQKCIFGFKIHVCKFYWIILNRDIVPWYASFIRSNTVLTSIRTNTMREVALSPLCDTSKSQTPPSFYDHYTLSGVSTYRLDIPLDGEDVVLWYIHQKYSQISYQSCFILFRIISTLSTRFKREKSCKCGVNHTITRGASVWVTVYDVTWSGLIRDDVIKKSRKNAYSVGDICL